jgi:hypothetical protein
MSITVFSDVIPCSLEDGSYRSVASTIRVKSVFTIVHIGYKSDVHYKYAEVTGKAISVTGHGCP